MRFTDAMILSHGNSVANRRVDGESMTVQRSELVDDDDVDVREGVAEALLEAYREIGGMRHRIDYLMTESREVGEEAEQSALLAWRLYTAALIDPSLPSFGIPEDPVGQILEQRVKRDELLDDIRKTIKQRARTGPYRAILEWLEKEANTAGGMVTITHEWLVRALADGNVPAETQTIAEVGTPGSFTGIRQVAVSVADTVGPSDA